jgi:hypothetical protein
MSRKNYTHTMDAFIHGNKWSNFEGVPSSTSFKLANPRMMATRKTYTSTPISIAEGDYEANKTTVTPAPAPTPTPEPIPIIQDIITKTDNTELTPETTVSPTPIETPYAVSLSDSDEIVGTTRGTRNQPIAGVQPTPVINVITTPVLPSTPIAVTPAPIGGGGGGFMGGAIPSTEKPKVTSAIAKKPSFLKKNWLPIALVVSAIYVYIKKPI